MAQSTVISFIVWPDGKIDERSLTVSGERIARQRFVDSLLPEEWLGRTSREYIADTLWKGMREKGFRSYTISIDKDGTPQLDS